jgi:hypothetical protein
MDAARQIYDHLGIEDMEAEDRWLLAGELIRLGKEPKALEILEGAVARQPEHPGAVDLLARLYAAGDRMALASELATRLSGRAGHEGRAWLLLGQLADGQADPVRAAQAYAKALEHDLSGASSTPAEVRKRLVRALLGTGRTAEALAALGPLLGASDPEAEWLLSRARLQQGDRAAAAVALAASQGFAPDPLAHEPSPFAGAASCASCHREIYDAQQSSHHATTFHAGDAVAKLKHPEVPVPDRVSPDVTHRLSPADGGLALETTRGGRTARMVGTFAFGSGDRGATPVGTDAQGRVREMRISHYGAGADWDLTTGHPDVPTGAADDPTDPTPYLGRLLDADAQRRCFDCHTTSTPNARARTGPAAADRGIGCERCHGPAQGHVLAMNAAPAFADMAIARPRLATDQETLQLCARCHSPRNMEVSRDDPTSIRFQATTLTWSRCHSASGGALSCLSCHDPHRDAVTEPAYYVSKCLACHAPPDVTVPAHAADDGARPVALPADVARVPCPVNPRDGCVSCHMPTRRGIIPHTEFTDHHIRVHRDDARAASVRADLEAKPR